VLRHHGLLAGIYPALVLSSSGCLLLKGGPIAGAGGGGVRQAVWSRSSRSWSSWLLGTLTIYRRPVFALKDAHTPQGRRGDAVRLARTETLRDAVKAVPGCVTRHALRQAR